MKRDIEKSLLSVLTGVRIKWVYSRLAKQVYNIVKRAWS